VKTPADKSDGTGIELSCSLGCMLIALIMVAITVMAVLL
jgi:hypothetical protein